MCTALVSDQAGQSIALCSQNPFCIMVALANCAGVDKAVIAKSPALRKAPDLVVKYFEKKLSALIFIGGATSPKQIRSCQIKIRM